MGATTLYERWGATLFGAPLPAEPKATCASCAMASPDMGDERFDPQTKCCTYLPILPSYLVGRALLDADPAAARGRASIAARIKRRTAVTPFGLGRPRAMALLHQGRSEAAFGRSGALLCPHFVADGGACGIWKHRNGACTAYFCKHDRGAVGARFWGAFADLLGAVERALVRHCAVALDVGGDALLRLCASPEADARGREIDGVVDDATYAALWGSWAGREEAYFRACADVVEPLSWGEVVAIGGAEIAAFAQAARAARASLDDRALCARVHVPELHVIRRKDDVVRLRGYSATDPIDVPRATFDALARADGATIDEAGLDDATARALLDFGVLRPRSRD